MTLDHPLRFEHIFRRYLWGGRRLETVLGKRLGPGEDYAESWEIVDRGADQSRVAHGPLAGATLRELMAAHAADLVGDSARWERFPLLVKFLDARQTLSVQVHPNDEQAARLAPPDLGKTEAWVVLAAEPTSRIYAGLAAGVDRQRLVEALAAGDVERVLHSFVPQVGDCVFLPAGTVHALGAGLLVAEIQQSSDTTFRLFDWNRVGADGRPRPLHLEQALDVIDFHRGPSAPQTPRPLHPEHDELVACSSFVLERRWIDGPARIGAAGGCAIVVALQGALAVAGDPAHRPLVAGETMLLPAALGEAAVSADEPTLLLLARPTR